MKQTTKKRVLICTLLAAVCFVSCKKEDIEVYNNGRYVQFTSDVSDSISFSFFYHLGKNEVTIPLPVKLTGQLAPIDQNYQIEAIPEQSTVTASNYNLPPEQTFRKGNTRDTAWVTVKKTPELDNKELRLVLRITGSKELSPGQTDCTYKILRITAKVSKPTWWDTNMDTYYLGRYSEKKFRTFMAVTGVGDLTPYDNNQRLILFLQFKYYLIEQKSNGTPVYMEDGADMLNTVPLIG